MKPDGAQSDPDAMADDGPEEIYSGGFYSIMRNVEHRQRPYIGADEVLPDADTDLGALIERIVPPSTVAPDSHPKRDFRNKRDELQTEFAGQDALLFLHAQVNAALRRRDAPPQAEPLFQRLWAEHGAHLAERLTVRWKISAATSFASHGRNAVQCSLGMGLSVMFDMIKIHDSERRLSGAPGRRPFARPSGAQVHPLPFGMTPYDFGRGDLDENMLARLWALSEQDAVIAPLARSMLHMAITDQRTIFARARRLRKRKARRTADG